VVRARQVFVVAVLVAIVAVMLVPPLGTMYSLHLDSRISECRENASGPLVRGVDLGLAGHTSGLVLPLEAKPEQLAVLHEAGARTAVAIAPFFEESRESYWAASAIEGLDILGIDVYRLRDLGGLPRLIPGTPEGKEIWILESGTGTRTTRDTSPGGRTHARSGSPWSAVWRGATTLMGWSCSTAGDFRTSGTPEVWSN
jgi:hypothetical protein